MQITVEVKSVYGQKKIYPVCDKAQIFADMLRQKTFSHSDLIKIEKLGYVILAPGQTLQGTAELIPATA